MAAPTGTSWSSIVGNYGRIGVYASLSGTSATSRTLKLDIWFWSKYSISDTANTLYYSFNSKTPSTVHGSCNINTSVSSGEGWSKDNQVLLTSKTTTVSLGKTQELRYLSAKITDVDRVGESLSMTAWTPITIPPKTSYTVSYNANGGSGAPGTQTKWYGDTLTLSSGAPTREGYIFKGWATTSTATTATYQPGASYTSNAALSLYAVWAVKTYTVGYNANGGSGAPAAQTKTHGTTLTLSSTKPTRTNYAFKGWARTPTATSEEYAAGASYVGNGNVTLYAVWELVYLKPRIFNLKVTRCNDSGVAADDGIYALITFDYECDKTPVEFDFEYGHDGVFSQGGATKYTTSGSVSYKVGLGTLSLERTYTFNITATDGGGSTSATKTLPGNKFAIDFRVGGEGVSFGKPAELGAEKSLGGVGVADFNYDGNFRQPVYGKALGMDKLPAIPENSALNDFRETGCYAVYSNDAAKTIANIPVASAGRFEVWSATGEGVRAQQWSYLRQRFIPYNKENAAWEREVTRSDDNNWRFSDWWRSSLTPNASQKVYHNQKVLWGDDMESGMYMTAGHTATLAEKVSEQANGIVLVFSYYNNASDTNWGWITRYVPKIMVELQPGGGHTFELTNGKFGSVGTKYLYINDDSIVGHADNNLTGTGSGITFANNKFVLRYVLGV